MASYSGIICISNLAYKLIEYHALTWFIFVVDGKSALHTLHKWRWSDVHADIFSHRDVRCLTDNILAGFYIEVLLRRQIPPSVGSDIILQAVSVNHGFITLELVVS